MILYGSTLRPYLLSEVIGQTLVESAEVPVRAIFTNDRDMLPLAALRPEEVFYVAPLVVGEGQGTVLPCNANSARMGRWNIEAYTGAVRNIEYLRELVDQLTTQVDLCEPFERIQAALAEALSASGDLEEGGDERTAA